MGSGSSFIQDTSGPDFGKDGYNEKSTVITVLFLCCGCPTRIRTQTNRVRVCRATFTQSGNSNMNYYNGSGEKVKTYRKKTAFIFYFWRKVPLIACAARRTIHIANAKPMKERNKPCLTRKPRKH